MKLFHKTQEVSGFLHREKDKYVGNKKAMEHMHVHADTMMRTHKTA